VSYNLAQTDFGDNRGWMGAVERAASQMGRLELSLLLTLLLLIFYPPRYVYISLPLSVMAISAIVFPTLRRGRLLWLVAALLVGVVSVINWHSTDNHKFLLCYWCLAIYCSLGTKDPEQSLAQIARWLVAAVMSVAVLQKFLSSDYLSADFFYFELLFDKRFAGLAQYVGGIQEFVNELNTSARRALVNYDSSLTAVKLSSNGSLLYLARFITWWNFLIQLMIASAFLAPSQTWIANWRHPLLLIFLFSTYLFAPVIGFGWVLIILGIAQLDSTAARTRLFYLLAFILLQVYKYPWSTLIPGN
jgi:hypothetical protein